MEFPTFDELLDINRTNPRWYVLQNLPNEEWKDIQDYEGLYQVSNYGRVKSLERWADDKHYCPEHIMKGYVNFGYVIVVLSKFAKTKHYRVHRLVAENFLKNEHNYTIINHINENKIDNRVNNIEWCSIEYNANYGNRNIKIAKRLGKRIVQKTLSGDIIATFPSLSETSRITGYNIAPLSRCCNGIQDLAYGYKWEFIDE